MFGISVTTNPYKLFIHAKGLFFIFKYNYHYRAEEGYDASSNIDWFFKKEYIDYFGYL